jgi:DNA-binding transcriptional LysR family regulator
MDLRQMKYFLAVAEEGLITAAADRLHMTQSPLSQQILSLEKEIGIPLFKRQKKRMVLTEAGEALRSKAQLIMELSEEAVCEARDAGKGGGQRIAIGSINSSGRSLLPELVKQFLVQYPGAQFDLRQGSTSQILDWLDHGVIHLGFIRYPVSVERYRCLALPPENQLAVIPKALLGEGRNILALEDLAAFPILLHRRYASAFLAYFQERGRSPRILLTSDEIIPLLTWARCGLGIAVVPEFAASVLPSGDTVSLPIRIPMNPAESSALIWRKNQGMPVAAQAFIRLFQKSLKEKIQGTD